MVKLEDKFNALLRVEKVEELIARVEALENANKEKDLKIKQLEEELKKKHAGTSPIDWSNIFKTDAKKSAEELNIVNAITAVNRDTEKREKNIVIVGMKLSLETDNDKRIEADRKGVSGGATIKAT